MYAGTASTTQRFCMKFNALASSLLLLALGCDPNNPPPPNNNQDPFCGDGIVQDGEECDDGNNLPGDACHSLCENPPVEDSFTANEVDQGFFFDFARYCVGMETRHATSHEKDLEDGNLRWRCGDITDVEQVAEFGQEYCEYSAILNGEEFEDSANIPEGESFSCLFTAVFNDAEDADAENIAALAQPENLGVAVDATLARMEIGINSRGAADGLISACTQLADPNFGFSENEKLNLVREAACAQAFVAAESAGDTALAAELLDACQGVNLAVEANFAIAAALGVTVSAPGEANFDTQHNIAGCVATGQGGGAFFRNSDTQICNRIFRAADDCGCSFEAIPDVVKGFSFSTWFTPENDRVPPECRPAIVNGQASEQLLICDVPLNEIAQIKASEKYSTALTSFCNDRFAKNIGMLAPLSAITSTATCNDVNNFCTSFRD
jgi:cysteine-rich repeat protein